MRATAIDNLYLVKNGNGTVDTMACADRKMVGWVALSGVKEVTQIPVTAPLDLRAEELSFSYRTSQN